MFPNIRRGSSSFFSLPLLVQIQVVVLALVVVEFHVLVVVNELLSLTLMDFEYDIEREC